MPPRGGLATTAWGGNEQHEFSFAAVKTAVKGN